VRERGAAASEDPPCCRRLALAMPDGLAIVDVGSGRRRVLRREGDLSPVAWSPDGRSLAGDVGGRMVLVDARSGRMTPLPLSAGIVDVTWSPDGTRLAFQVER
jgi:Tol biopolymer transport system component